MIHLSISESHLLCIQWTLNNDKPFLLSVSNKALPKPLSILEQSENEIISVINAGLHLIREDISFEGEQVFVTIPDKFTNSVLISSDEDMTENDTWDYAVWTLQQRWSSALKLENFGRSFGNNTNSLFAISISTTFTEPIKMAILELGAVPVWMGTESSVFFGLNPEKGCTVFNIEKNSYSYYQYSQSSFQNGIAKFLKGKWNLQALNGSSNIKDVFKGQLLAAGKLSEQRKAHFKGHRIKQLISLSGINFEANILTDDVKEEDLYIFSALATGVVEGVSINFFDQPGIQPFNFVKKEIFEDSNNIQKLTTSAKIKKSKEKKKEKKKKKKDGIILKVFLYIFFIFTIASMLVYDQRPDVFKKALLKINDIRINNFFSSNNDSVLTNTDYERVEIPKFVEKQIIPFSESSINSQILIATALKTLSLTDSHEIILLSLSDGNMDLELLGGKSMAAPIDSIGDVLNYSLRQVSGESQFKHGYLVEYNSLSKNFIEGSKEEVDSLKLYIQNIENSLFKELSVIDKDSKTQIPIIIRLNGDNYIQTFLNYILSKTKNLALEKFVYKGKSLESLPTAFFYISIYNTKNTELVE